MQRRTFLRSLAVMAANHVFAPFNWDRKLKQTEPFDVYLTLDDGPFVNRDLKSGPTDTVLRIFQDKNVQATFFLHGRHINNWHGPVLARFINEGHSIGNHLWSQGGNTVLEKPTRTRLAYQFLLTEERIRTMMQQADDAAYQRYLAQGKLFRRPGGANHLNEFLDPANFFEYEHLELLRFFWDRIDWLRGVYDYSGWHINGGESIPLSIRPYTPEGELSFVLRGRNGYYGVYDYLGAGKPPQRSIEAQQGLVVLLHDADENTDLMLPKLIDELHSLGARFRALPRPIDRPNTKSVGIGYPPTVKPIVVV